MLKNRNSKDGAREMSRLGSCCTCRGLGFAQLLTHSREFTTALTPASGHVLTCVPPWVPAFMYTHIYTLKCQLKKCQELTNPSLTPAIDRSSSSTLEGRGRSHASPLTTSAAWRLPLHLKTKQGFRALVLARR